MAAYTLTVTTGSVVLTCYARPIYTNLKKFKRISRRRRLRSVKKIVRNKQITY